MTIDLLLVWFIPPPRKWVPFNDEKVNLSAIHDRFMGVSQNWGPQNINTSEVLRLNNDATGSLSRLPFGGFGEFSGGKTYCYNFQGGVEGASYSNPMDFSNHFGEVLDFAKILGPQRFQSFGGATASASSWLFVFFSPRSCSSKMTKIIRSPNFRSQKNETSTYKVGHPRSQLPIFKAIYRGYIQYNPFRTSFITSRGPPCSFFKLGELPHFTKPEFVLVEDLPLRHQNLSPHLVELADKPAEWFTSVRCVSKKTWHPMEFSFWPSK